MAAVRWGRSSPGSKAKPAKAQKVVRAADTINLPWYLGNMCSSEAEYSCTTKDTSELAHKRPPCGPFRVSCRMCAHLIWCVHCGSVSSRVLVFNLVKLTTVWSHGSGRGPRGTRDRRDHAKPLTFLVRGGASSWIRKPLFPDRKFRSELHFFRVRTPNKRRTPYTPGVMRMCRGHVE